MSHPADEITDVVMGTTYVISVITMPVIVLTRRNGGSTKVTSWGLTEHSDVVLARLRDALGLPKGGVIISART